MPNGNEGATAPAVQQTGIAQNLMSVITLGMTDTPAERANQSTAVHLAQVAMGVVYAAPFLMKWGADRRSAGKPAVPLLNIA